MFWAEEYIEEKNFVHSSCVYKTQHGRTRYKFPITIRMCMYVVSISVFESAMSICILRWKKKYSVQNFFPNNIIMHALQYGVLFSDILGPLADRVYELVQVTAE